MSSEVKNEVLSTLAIMGYSDNYIERAMKIHNKSKFGTDYNLSLLVEIIDRLKQKDAKKNKGLKNNNNKTLPFCPHFQSVNETIQYLRTHNTIDFRFENGRYILCKILEKDLQYEHKILLHPASQPLHMTKHNKYCFIYQEYTKLAFEKSVTLRKISNKNHALYFVSMDEFIDVNPSFKEGHGGWKHGQIIKQDPNSSQVKVLYFFNNENHSFWIHLENKNEASKLNSKYNPLSDHIIQNFNEFQDEHPLKRFTSIDVIDNNNFYNASVVKPNNQISEQQKEEDAINQLMNFGYERKQIIHAINISKDKTDINEIIECIERQEQNQRNQNQNKNKNHQQYENVNQKQQQQQQEQQHNGGMFSFHKIQISEIHSDVNNMPNNMPNNSIEIDYNMIVDDGKDDDQPYNVMKGLEVKNLNRPQDFDDTLSSMAFGNGLMMDDIIDQMEMGDDGQNGDEDDIDDVHSTPMGPTPMGPEPPKVGMSIDDNNNKDMVLIEGNAPNGEGYHNNPLMEGIGKNKKNYKKPADDYKHNNHKNNINKHKNGNNYKIKSPKSPKLGSLWKFGKKNKQKKNAIFGVDPNCLSSTLIIEKDYKSPIPNVLIKLRKEFFTRKGHLIEGIFRVAPNKDECKMIEDQLNDGKLLNINFGILDGDLIGNLIKLWFRSMPNPICQALVGKNKIETCTTIKQAERIVEKDIKEPNKSYMLWLLDLCLDTIEHISINKMSVKAMAVVIAPNLYDPDKLGDPMIAMTFSAKLIKFMEHAIQWRQKKLG